MTTMHLLSALLLAYLGAGLLRFGLPRLPARWAVQPVAEDDAGSCWFLILLSVAVAVLSVIRLHSRHQKGGGVLETGDAEFLAVFLLMFAMVSGFLGIARYPARSLRPGLIGTLLIMVVPMALIGLCLWLLGLPASGPTGLVV